MRVSRWHAVQAGTDDELRDLREMKERLRKGDTPCWVTLFTRFRIDVDLKVVESPQADQKYRACSFGDK